MKWIRKTKLKQRQLGLSESNVVKAIEGWTILRAGGREATGLEIPTIPSKIVVSAGPIRFALGKNGESRVLLPLSERETLRGLSGAPSLQITVSTFLSTGEKQSFLDLTCLSSELEDVFSDVTDEILARVISGQGCIEAARTTIDDFRALLIRPRSKDVSMSTIVGLVGELVFLDRLLDRTPQAWRCWRGPVGDRHDFRSGNSSVEVKSTTRVGDTTVIVNTLEQFEVPTGGNLHLLHLTLEPVVDGLISISKLARSVFAKSDDSDRVKELLVSLGCSDADAEAWNGTSFRLEGETIYEVSDGFPRLVPSMFPGAETPAGVSDVSYKVDLSVATEFAKERSRTVKIEEALVKCL